MIPPIPSRKEAVQERDSSAGCVAVPGGAGEGFRARPGRYAIAPGEPTEFRSISGPSPGRGRACLLVPRGFAGSPGSMGFLWR